MKAKTRKLTSEEKVAVIGNLVAHGLLSRVLDLDSNTIEFKITKKGIQTYATILSMLGRTKILNGPSLSKPQIKYHTLERLKDLVQSQKFVEYIESDEVYITERGAQHIKVMFSIKNDITPKSGILSRLKNLKD